MPATYEPIATTTLGTAASTITLSSVPATYTDLRLVVNVIPSTTFVGFYLGFNGVASATYSTTRLYGNGSTITSSRDTTGTGYSYILVTDGYPPTSNPYLITADVFSYAGSTQKTVLSSSDADGNGSGRLNRSVSKWNSTAAISQINLSTTSGNFSIGTTATLYGILKA